MTETRRIVSGIKPSGHLHLGNYAGALRQWVALQEMPSEHTFFFIADLHALTEKVHGSLAQWTHELVCHLLAAGCDPHRVTLFRQSDVRGHAELAWYFSTVVPVSRLSLMTQYKDKTLRNEETNTKINAGLLYYPILQAADIALYNGTHVPVGKDQIQHIELTRDIVGWFHHHYAPHIFNEPQPMLTDEELQKILSLSDPTRKMSKSDGGDGCIFLNDTTDSIARKIKAAVTDSGEGGNSPGVRNLIALLRLCGNNDSAYAYTTASANGTLRYRELKESLTETVSAFVADHQKKFNEWMTRPDDVARILNDGAQRAQSYADTTLLAVRQAIGIE